MFATLVRFSRTTYRGARGSGPGASGRTDARSSPKSRNTLGKAIAAGQAFRRSQTGLYHLTQIQSGNNVPKSRRKTSRTWKPNVQVKRIESKILGETIKMKVTTKAIRCIKKAGGLDQYIRSTKDEALGEFGRSLRSEMAAVAGLRLQMEQMGLVPTIGQQGPGGKRSVKEKQAPAPAAPKKASTSKASAKATVSTIPPNASNRPRASVPRA